MAELADALASGASWGNSVQVRFLLSALKTEIRTLYQLVKGSDFCFVVLPQKFCHITPRFSSSVLIPSLIDAKFSFLSPVTFKTFELSISLFKRRS